MCKNLKVTKNALMVKKERLKLGTFLENGDYITWNQLLVALNIKNGDGYKVISWIQNRNFPIKYKRVNRNRFKIVCLEEFWKWAEKNRELIDFSRLEENILGIEPDWVKQQRKLDYKNKMLYKTTPWTPAEDRRLLLLLREFKYTYLELSKKLNRTSGAIQRRIIDLKFRERPIKADNHIKWTDEEKEKLLILIRQGAKYPLIADQLIRSDKAIRGKVYQLFKTENLDKVRKIMKEEPV